MTADPLQPREHYLPIRQDDLVTLLDRDLQRRGQDSGAFRQLCHLIASMYHFKYHRLLRSLKGAYAPFDPDADTRILFPVGPEEKQSRLEQLIAQFIALLERANFERLIRDDIVTALKDRTYWGLNLDLDFGVFDRIEVFARGDAVVRRKRICWSWFRRREVEVDLAVFRRLVVILKLQPHKRLPKQVDTESVYIKVFKDIPKLDLEMLLPGTRAKMTLFDRLRITLPSLTGIGIATWKLATTSILALLTGGIGNTLALVGLTAAPVGYGWRSFRGYASTKQKYQLTLTESLYFQNLDNNSGALCHLIDEAEEQECREAILAYYFLWQEAGDVGWTREALDRRIETFLTEAGGVKLDFETSDAVNKMLRLGVVEESPDGHFRAASIEQTLQTLDRAWDGYFRFNQDLPADREGSA